MSLCSLRYVGGIWFVFVFFNFYRLDLHNETFFICKSMMKHKPKLNENWTSFDLVVVIGIACLLIS